MKKIKIKLNGKVKSIIENYKLINLMNDFKIPLKKAAKKSKKKAKKKAKKRRRR